MPDIFISYRRDDTSGYAGRLYDQISQHVGADHVFMDVADIGPGSDFVEVIEKQVGTCDALVALIGTNWLTAKDNQDRPRLGNAGDFVSVVGQRATPESDKHRWRMLHECSILCPRSLRAEVNQ